MERWNRKINSIIGRKTPDVFLLVKKGKEAVNTAFMKRKNDLGEMWTKGAKAYIPFPKKNRTYFTKI